MREGPEQIEGASVEDVAGQHGFIQPKGSVAEIVHDPEQQAYGKDGPGEGKP
jgi:hypothetical protein